MSRRGGHSSRTVRKSREVIIATFSSLVLNGHYAELGVRDLARRAGIGRSTFYEHFDDKIALLIESMHPLLVVLADAVTGANAAQLVWLLAHFEEQRENALSFFNGSPERTAIEGAVARLVADQLPRGNTILPRVNIAALLSRTAIGLIADWLADNPRISRDEFAAVLVKTSRACRSALL